MTNYCRYSHMQPVMQSNNNAIYGMWGIGTDHGWMEVKVQMMVHLDLLVNSLYLQKKAKNARHGSQKNKAWECLNAVGACPNKETNPQRLTVVEGLNH